MGNSARLSELILNNLTKVCNENPECRIVYEDNDLPYGKNNFLFFIKPEITLQSETKNTDRILDLIFKQLSDFGFRIHDIRILSAEYLEKYRIIVEHYGVIASVSNNSKKSLSESAKVKFREIYGISIDEAFYVGGDEFLKQYPFFNYHSLDCLWQNNENLKLASGTYCEKIRIDLDTVYLMNGFNPRQLKHFTEKGRCIVAFNLSGDITWSEARTNFIGATNPNKAASCSLRRKLLESKNNFGLSEVSQSYNGVHLSAGPVEALIELHRFDSDFSVPNGEHKYLEFPFGKKLAEAFGGKIPEEIINNANLSVEGKITSVFDLTEEKDSDEAINLLYKYLNN